MIKVSVIVPVYNVEKYIDKCLSSLVNQTLKNIEIIVVNDGSPDNSQKIIDRYVKKYPKKVKSFIKENGGLGSARNFGLKHVNGEYISFVDSDDYLDLNALEEMYNTAIKNKSDVVICDLVDHYLLDNNKEKIIYHNCTKYDSVYEVTPSACNKMFKKTIIGDLRFISKIWYEDLNFTTKILLTTNQISNIRKGFYHCNCGHISIMNNDNSLKNLDIITVLDDVIDYSKKNKKYNKNIISCLIYNHVLITSINRVAGHKNKDKNKVLKDLLTYCKKNIPDYKKQPFYNNISSNKRIIANLNYHGLWMVSKLILKIKSILGLVIK